MIYALLIVGILSFGAGFGVAYKIDSATISGLHQAIQSSNEQATSALASSQERVAQLRQLLKMQTLTWNYHMPSQLQRSMLITTLLSLSACSTPVLKTVIAPCQQIQLPESLLTQPNLPSFQQDLQTFFYPKPSQPIK